MEDAQKLQIIFQTLGDANRLRIIRLIGETKCSVTEIVQTTQLSQPLVSHHLRTLRENHILETERKGPFIYYKLKDRELLKVLDLFLKIFYNVNDFAKKNMPICFSPRWKNK
jgi:DNA-binding transcriptional ArsR family regulator